MPEYPDITLYVEALEQRIQGATLDHLQLNSYFLLRTAVPKLEDQVGHQVVEIRRLGKRIAIGLNNGVWLVFHLMIAGRLHWQKKKPGKTALIALHFAPTGSQSEEADGYLFLTEAGKKKRASLHVVEGESGLNQIDPKGLEVMTADHQSFQKVLQQNNHTLKRSLTDPNYFSGIGNAYSDEILHRARLSPIAMTQKLDDSQVESLFDAVQFVLKDWTDRLRAESNDEFPKGVTAFRPEMAVHGKFGQPCPVCETEIQRIRYSTNETNYCPRCQTEGKVLADRSLSRLLKKRLAKNHRAIGSYKGQQIIGRLF